MRALAAALACALLLAGCAGRAPAPASEGEEKVSYNRRELESRPGLLTGRDGTWTIYRSDGPPPPPPPRPPTTLSCERGQVCDPPAEAR
jgi:hypothetical protein